LLKAVIKSSSDQDNIRHRLVPTEVVTKWAHDVDALKHEVVEIMQEEKEEKQVSISRIMPGL
jgi:ATP-dependent RNA helicase DDX27